MKRVKLTLMDSCGNVTAAIVFQGSYFANVGDNVSLPTGQYGLLVRAELVMEAAPESTIDATKPA